MNQSDHVTNFIRQNIFLKIWKIQEKTIKNVRQLRLSENFQNFLQLTVIIYNFYILQSTQKNMKLTIFLLLSQQNFSSYKKFCQEKNNNKLFCWFNK